MLILSKELEDTAQNDHIQKHIPIGILVSESKPTLTKIVLLSKAEGSHSHNVRGLDFATLEKPMGDGRYEIRFFNSILVNYSVLISRLVSLPGMACRLAWSRLRRGRPLRTTRAFLTTRMSSITCSA